MATYGGPASTPRYSGTGHTAITGQNLLLLLGRVLLGAIFIQSGFGKLTNLGGFATSLEGMGVPFASGLAVVGAVVEFFGGLAIVLGAWTRLAAILMIGFTLAATLLAHRFWEFPVEQQTMQHIQFMKNLAITGGFLTVLVAGAGRFSIDGRRQRHQG